MLKILMWWLKVEDVRWHAMQLVKICCHESGFPLVIFRNIGREHVHYPFLRPFTSFCCGLPTKEQISKYPMITNIVKTISGELLSM